jgi:protease-4
MTRSSLRACAIGLALCLSVLVPASSTLAQLKIKIGAGNSDGQTAMATKPTVAVFKLESAIEETPGEDLALFGKPPVSLHELITRLRTAAKDENVKAVVILSEGGAFGQAQIEELRQAMEHLKSANKPIYVHSDSLNMGDYALFSGANRISVVPTADLWVVGFHTEGLYLRGLLDKLGVKPDFMHCGDYKSAAEIFMRDQPSKEADEMMNWLLDGIYDTHCNLIAKGRKVPVEQVKKWVDAGPYTADAAKKAGLIDAIEHRQDFEAMLRKQYGETIAFDRKYGAPKDEKLDLSSPFALFKILGEMMGGGEKKTEPVKPAVGIVYVDGPIDLGSGDASPLGGSQGAFASEVRKALNKAAEDDNIKAVVLRVDSPGGSAVASEIILDGTRRVKAKKPLVVSMGDVAGSGGYYVACASDTIFADESTITGSIGVVGGKLVTNDMWGKVGVTFKEYQRGKNAAILASSRTFNDEERAKIQSWMNEVYDVFKNHVTTIRGNRLKKPIDELAGGRVYTGRQALELGLIDKIGTLHDAIEFAAAGAKLGENYEVRIVPAPKNFLEKLFEDLGDGQDDPKHVNVSSLFKPGGASLVDLAMPYLQNLDPKRVGKIRGALETLDLLQRDGVMLTSPELMMMSK